MGRRQWQGCVLAGLLTLAGAARDSHAQGAPGAAAKPAQSIPQQPAHAADGAALLTLEGRGVQVYRCDASPGPAAWVLDHPEADLLDSRRQVVGHHDAGPAWHLDDGSTVTGALIEKKAAPTPGSVPWLWLAAAAHQGAGALAAVFTIRRTDTHGGLAPAQGCDASMVGATVRVPYTARYTFYGKP